MHKLLAKLARSATAPALLGLAIVALIGPPHALAQASLPTEITGPTWELVSLTPAGGAAEDTTGGGITLSFGPENAVSGSGGCNNYRSSYTTTGSGNIDFGAAAATLRACDEPEGSREGRFFVALDAVNTYALDGGRLTLSADDGTELIFTAQAAEGGEGGTTATPPATLPSTGGEGQSALWMALAAALLGGAGLALRRRAVP
ncbi:MAG TPA: META domain-containing protein [Chloroflexaceae bacterium]|nr:META domain-containing protein [Chloroflexaceae bacterium]